MAFLIRPRVVFALAAFLLAGCTVHAAPAQRVAAPLGVVLPANAKPGENYRGLYVGASRRAGSWTAPDATITVRKNWKASDLVLVFYVPDSSEKFKNWYREHPVGLDLAFSRGGVQHRCCFSGGIGSLHVALPAALRDARGSVTFHLHVSGAAVLHDVDQAFNDRRRLGVVVLRAFCS